MHHIVVGYRIRIYRNGLLKLRINFDIVRKYARNSLSSAFLQLSVKLLPSLMTASMTLFQKGYGRTLYTLSSSRVQAFLDFRLGEGNASCWNLRLWGYLSSTREVIRKITTLQNKLLINFLLKKSQTFLLCYEVMLAISDSHKLL